MLKIGIESVLYWKQLILTEYELRYLKIEPKWNETDQFRTSLSKERQTDIVC